MPAFNRILFLVDRNNLVRQTLEGVPGLSAARHRPPVHRDLQRPAARPRRARSGSEGRHLDHPAGLLGAAGKELTRGGRGAIELRAGARPDTERLVVYNPRLPIETFDFVITDECHRSIYGTWRQVLDYFDAHIVGLTATPSPHTLGFFNQNLVAEYPYERSVVDGVNVAVRSLPHPHRDRRAWRHASRRATSVPVRDRHTRAPTLRDARRGPRLTPDQTRPLGASSRTRSARCWRPIATRCSPSCSPAARRCRRR